MGKKMLALPLSGRENVIKWMEQFRNSNLGLKQSSLDIFDTGNNYTTNAKVSRFNKKVEIIVKALELKGVTVKKTPRGRYSLTATVLKKLKLEDFTPELHKLFFNDKLSEIKYDDPKVPSILQKLYDEDELDDHFDDPRVFKSFAIHNNIPALRWLIDTYNVITYEFSNPIMVDILIAANSDDVLDLYIEKGIIKSSLELTERTEPFRKLLTAPKNWLKKILPMVLIDEEEVSYDMSLIKMFYEEQSEYVTYFDFTEREWILLANYCIGNIIEDNFHYYEGCIAKMMDESKVFFSRLLEASNWVMYDKILENIPEIRDIFIF